MTLSASGSATASVLYAPYGAVRYSSGTMPTSYGFTGQRADAASGLDYYGSRYYDPLAGQFTSGDSVLPGNGYDLWGLSRYTYVEGNPEDRTDPSGHINVYMGDDGSPVPIENAFQGTYSWGSSPVVTYHRGFTRPYPAVRHRQQRWTPPRRTSPPRQQKAPTKTNSPAIDLGAAAGAVLSFGRTAAPVAVDVGGTAALDFLSVLLLPLASPCDSPPCNVSQARADADNLPTTGDSPFVPPKGKSASDSWSNEKKGLHRSEGQRVAKGQVAFSRPLGCRSRRWVISPSER